MTPVQPTRWVTLLWTLLGLATSAYYFNWLLRPEHVGLVWLFALLVVADLFNGFHAVSFWLTSLRGPRSRPFSFPARAQVDVLVPTLNEPVDLLERTIEAAQAMRGAEVVAFVLDDGDRPEVAALAERIGARYIAREEHKGAKAGNINNALRVTAEAGAPFVCVFDSDHVPLPEFLERTLGFFTEPRVALIQTPQVYANSAAGPLTRGAAEQQAIFFGPICSGRDGYDSAFCCGTNFVARRDVLTEAGGFPEDSITEDIVLSTEIVGLGYEIAYVPEPLAAGLGPEDARSYISQQMRWATGCLDLLFRRPSVWRPLSWTQRWQYFVATSYWLTGWTILVYMSLPVLRLLFGWQPVSDSSDAFAIHFLPYFLVSIVNLGRFTSGGYTLAGLGMNWGSFAIHVRATLRALLGRNRGFAVTSKRALGGIPWGMLLPNLAVIALLLGACLVAGSRSLTAATLNNITFALLDAALVGLMIVFSVRQARLSRRRQAERVDAQSPIDWLPAPAAEAASAAGGPLPVYKRVRRGLGLRSNWLQLARFCVVGASGYVVNLLVFAFFVEVLGNPPSRRRDGGLRDCGDQQLLVEPRLDVWSRGRPVELPGDSLPGAERRRVPVRGGPVAGARDRGGCSPRRGAGGVDRPRHATELRGQSALGVQQPLPRSRGGPAPVGPLRPRARDARRASAPWVPLAGGRR